MTRRSVRPRVKKAAATPAMPAPTIATSVLASASSGRGGPSGASWATQGDRLGRSWYVPPDDAPTVTRPSPPRGLQPVEDEPRDALDRDPLLGHRIAIADRDRAVLERVDVDRHAPWRADLVLAPVELADRGGVVVDRHHVALQVVLDPMAQLDDLGSLLEQRQDRDLVRREVRVERQRDAGLAPDLLLAIGVDQEREGGPVRAGGRLDHPRDDVLVGRLVEVLEASPDAAEWRDRSKSPRLWTPSSSFQPNGKRYSMSTAFLA